MYVYLFLKFVVGSWLVERHIDFCILDYVYVMAYFLKQFPSFY